jgi:molecular chaperone HtpG
MGPILKEGPRLDWSNRERIADLLLFESLRTPAGEFTTLAKYVEAMRPEQNEIYYLTGETREQLEGSPYLETFKAKEQDVLFLTDPIDEFMVPALASYKGKKLKAVDRAEPGDSGVDASEKEKFAKLLESLKGKLPEVSDVRLSSRLKESACCLVAGEGAASAHFERLMHSWGKGEEMRGNKRILELNAAHPAVQALHKLYEKDPQEPRIEGYARLLYDQAVIAEGSRVKDPAAMARRINELLVKDAGG